MLLQAIISRILGLSAVVGEKHLTLETIDVTNIPQQKTLID